MDKTHEFTLMLVKKWCVALCEKSRHCKDFGNVRLMYSLLKGKGFDFPHVSPSEINAIVGDESTVCSLSLPVLPPATVVQDKGGDPGGGAHRARGGSARASPAMLTGRSNWKTCSTGEGPRTSRPPTS